MDLAELSVLRERELLDDEVAGFGNEPRWMLTLATSRRLRGVA